MTYYFCGAREKRAWTGGKLAAHLGVPLSFVELIVAAGASQEPGSLSPVAIIAFLVDECAEVRRLAGLPPLPEPGPEAAPAVLANFRATGAWLTMAEYRALKCEDAAEKAKAAAGVRLWRREIVTLTADRNQRLNHWSAGLRNAAW
jgi:hypothetical protein